MRFAGIFGQAGKDTIIAHDGMLTCVDSIGNILVTGGLDKKVKVWDLRQVSSSGSMPLRQIAVDETVVLKVALGLSGSYAAVSTLNGLYLADLSTGSNTRSVEFSDRRTIRRYHDLAWNGPQLYAAGDDCRVDLYNIGE
jgi:WD40 repeat protein